MDSLKKCQICPRNCKVNRYTTKGFCGLFDKIKVARCALHYYEEPSISGSEGSGAVFFSHCNLKCCYCQNYTISTMEDGVEISVERLCDIFLELQESGANNINLVTPTMYILQIKEALVQAKKRGLKIPIVYNSSGYEKVDSLKLLDGLIDIYMPDFKYIDNGYALKYSKCKDYVENVKEAIKEMYRQVGDNQFDDKDIMIKGVIVRHLLLPNLEDDAKKIIKYLYDTYQNHIYISIMNQYTPLEHVKEYPEINRCVREEEYNRVLDYAIHLGVENAYIQESGTQSDSFIPSFDYTGVLKKK